MLLGVSSGVQAQENGREKESRPPLARPRTQGISQVPAEARQRADAFFALLRMNRVEEAYQKLFEGSAVADENPDTVSTLVDSTKRLLSSTGDIGTTEFLRVRSAGRTLLEVTWILNGRKRPVRWRIYFYQNGDGWQVLDTDVSTAASGFFDGPELDDSGR